MMSMHFARYQLTNKLKIHSVSFFIFVCNKNLYLSVIRTIMPKNNASLKAKKRVDIQNGGLKWIKVKFFSSEATL